MLTKKNLIPNLFLVINILGLLFLSFSSIAQTNSHTDNKKQFYKVISFGEKIDFGNVENTATFTITNTKENIVANLRGTQINNYIFEKPGIYEIHFFENKVHKTDECHHEMFNENMSVKVNSFKMEFNFSKIQFSEKIQKGKHYDNLVITVPVNISTKENTPTKENAPNMEIAGVGSELIAKPLNNEIIIENGVQLLKYQLSGTVNSETYLMFDFFDLNNEVQTYNLLEKIN
ncbi:MAG: hypothetical protein V4572_08720 [Bacteroidota bacterium]